MRTVSIPLQAGRWVGLLLGGILVLSGCRTAPEAAVEGESVAEDVPPAVLVEEVTLGPGDVVEVKFFYAPELDDVQTIRPDGRISLQLVGEVEAHGKSPASLRDELKRLYEPYMEKPEIAVIVRELNSRAVFVGGAVNNAGRIAMPGRLTALGAVIEAGGLDPVTAHAKHVVVIRQSAAPPSVEIVNLNEAVDGGEPYFLQPMDIVYVPRRPIANLNQWIEQHFNRIVPQFGLTYVRTSTDGRESVGIDTSAR